MSRAISRKSEKSYIQGEPVVRTGQVIKVVNKPGELYGFIEQDRGRKTTFVSRGEIQKLRGLFVEKVRVRYQILVTIQGKKRKSQAINIEILN